MDVIDHTQALDGFGGPGSLEEPGGPTRRRFLQGLAAAGGIVSAGIPTWLAGTAGAATPIGATDGVLVVVNLLGGNDGLNTLVPRGAPERGRYETLRGTLALPTSSLFPVGDGAYGLHASLKATAARFATGRVAIVNGVGSNGDLSHFATQATMMAGTTGSSRSTGWLGRYGDGLTEWDSGQRGIAIGATVPLHLVGARTKVTALPSVGGLWGSDVNTRWERSAFDAVRAFAGAPTGLGAMADKAAAAGRDAVDRAGQMEALYSDTLAGSKLGMDLTLAARVVNANLGTRCITVERQGFDTHAQQPDAHAALLAELDSAIEGFFTLLAPSFRQRVTMLVVSEFGRRPMQNAGLGTDHGNAGLALVIGDNVRGGVYGSQPSLSSFDANGNLTPTVDIRSVYGSVLRRWLDGDDTSVLGKSFEDLNLFTAGPGVTGAPGPVVVPAA